MREAVLVALITGGISLIGSILTYLATTSKSKSEVQSRLDVMNNQLTNMNKILDKVEKRVESVPVLEEKFNEANRRLNKLEKVG